MRNINFLVITPDSKVYAFSCTSEVFLSNAQAHVGGYVDVATRRDGKVCAWVHDEGLLIGLDRNPLVEALLQRRPLVGTAVITGGTDADGDTLSVPPSFVDEVLALASIEWVDWIGVIEVR